MEDKYAAQKKYGKKNIKKLGCSFNKDLVDEFAEACRKLNIKQTDIIKKAMREVIDQANK